MKIYIIESSGSPDSTILLPPRERSVVREHSLNFVLSLVQREGEGREGVASAVVVLVQHMAAKVAPPDSSRPPPLLPKVPDMSDWRREAVYALLLLLEALPGPLLQVLTMDSISYSYPYPLDLPAMSAKVRPQ